MICKKHGEQRYFSHRGGSYECARCRMAFQKAGFHNIEMIRLFGEWFPNERCSYGGLDMLISNNGLKPRKKSFVELVEFYFDNPSVVWWSRKKYPDAGWGVVDIGRAITSIPEAFSLMHASKLDDLWRATPHDVFEAISFRDCFKWKWDIKLQLCPTIEYDTSFLSEEEFPNT